jgi:cytochrome c biogenesis protein CcmG/thiol:disulfide interchange protein DsbE
MDDQDKPTPRTDRFGTVMWLLIGVFVVAVGATLFLGTRSGDATTTTFADLGDLTANDPNVPGTDESAPGFALETLLGETFDLQDRIAADGRPVILNLWASWCAPCRSEMPAIDSASQQHPEVTFVGVAVQDTHDNAVAFAEEIGVSYTLAVDDGTVEDAYPVLGLPATFFIDSSGTIVKRHFGVVTVDSLDTAIDDLFG